MATVKSGRVLARDHGTVGIGLGFVAFFQVPPSVFLLSLFKYLHPFFFLQSAMSHVGTKLSCVNSMWEYAGPL